MNIDILNAYCGIGFHRCHACLRVGLLSIATPQSPRGDRRGSALGRRSLFHRGLRHPKCRPVSRPAYLARSLDRSAALVHFGRLSPRPALLLGARSRERKSRGRTVARLLVTASARELTFTTCEDRKPAFQALFFWKKSARQKSSVGLNWPSSLRAAPRGRSHTPSVDLRSDEITR